jgi:hypothetical protein
MPNGDPNFDFQAMEQFFAPIAEAVREFAKRRNLLVDKYYHDGRDWSLRFNHPKGGQASIELLRDARDRLLISSAWHFDDYEKSMRFLYTRDVQTCPRDPIAVAKAIEDELQSIIAANFGAWQQGHHCPWERYTREEFEAMIPKYPNPKLNS